MTTLPAETFGMKGRGKLATNYFADIAVLDLNTITDHATYLKPHQYAEGIKHLLINGQISIEHGNVTGVRSGKALRMT